MATFNDYLRARGGLNFTQSPLNEVDTALLTMLAYLDWEGIVPSKNAALSVSLIEAAKAYFVKISKSKNRNVFTFSTPGIEKILKQLIKYDRYSSVNMCLFEQDTDFNIGRQFAAITYMVKDKAADNIVAFRGTDSTLIGWREDFALAYMKSIPAQQSASKYLNYALIKLPGRFIVSGHSKGGNLAVYASARAGRLTRKKITEIYNFDGPGFEFSFTERKMFKCCEEKVINYIPQESIVGMILEPIGKRKIVQSRGRGFYQHDALLWKIDKTNFSYGELTDVSKIIDYILSEWLGEMNINEREAFVTSLFDLLGAKEGEAFTNAPIYNLKLIIRIMQKYSKYDAEKKAVITSILGNLRTSAAVTIKSSIINKKQRTIEE